MRKPFLLIVLVLPCLAEIEHVTGIKDVYYRGDSEQIGHITVTLNSDLFAEVDADNPVFMRLRLSHHARLAQTLVEQGTDHEATRPIYLAMRLHTLDSGFRLIAGPETLSIVRWVEGEDEIWFRLASSSSSWIEDPGGNAIAPADHLVVSWTVGISARQSWFFQANAPEGSTNLPANTYDPDQPEKESAASTLIYTNLSESLLASSGVESLLEYDAPWFQADAEIGVGIFSAQEATPYPMLYFGTNTIARAIGETRERRSDFHLYRLPKVKASERTNQ